MGRSTNPNTTTPSASNDSRRTLLRMLKYLLPHKWTAAVILSLVLLVNGTALLKPYFMKLIIDDFIEPANLRSGGISIPMAAGAYMGVIVLGSLGQYLQTCLISSVGQKIMKRLREEVFKTIQYLPLSYLDKTTAGRLITRATNDVEALSELFTDILVSVIKDGVLLFGIVYAMAILSVPLTAWSFTVLPAMFALVFLIRHLVHKNWVILKGITSQLNTNIAENISGMKVVQLFNGEKDRFKAFDRLNEQYFDRSLVQMKLHSLSGPSANIFESLAIGIILWVGMKAMHAGDVGIGDITALTMYIRQFFTPVSDLAESLTSIESALVSSSRIFELLDEADILEDLDQGEAMGRPLGRIEFKHVWFAYEGDNWVLKDVSFVIEPGETSALVGETGAGKTTIISLITGFYPVTRGEILIDGKNIQDIKKSDLRKSIALVLQEVFLFAGDIRFNLTLNDDIAGNRLAAAIRDANADKLINGFQAGLAEPVMERGATLSMGQRQLLALARALARDPAIIIMDEATANIDTKTEKMIQGAIEKAASRRTAIIIAHRLSTIRSAQQIIVMSHGEVLETGSHGELMQRASTYRNMVEKGAAGTS